MNHLEERGELLRIDRPVDVVYEAGAIADLLVKNNGPAVLFEQPRLADGSVSSIPLLMNAFGSHDRTLRALGASHETEIGDRMVAMMKPDIGLYMRKPWKGLPLLRDALAMPPKKVRKGKAQRVRLPNDLTKLPIPKTWPMDGGHFVTLPLVVTKDSSGEHNLGMYRAQVHNETELGLHWQIHKHGADHAADGERMPVAVCIGGPPELIFSAISPLPDNLSEYQFAGILGQKSLPITKALTQDLWVPAEADIIIEGYCDPTETKLEGPFGDHYGFYSLTGQYPVLHVTAITCRSDAILPATIVGLPPMEDGYLGEAIGRQFSPVLQFQHRDVRSVHLPLETGFHNLAIVASKQRYPRQGRKTAMGLLGAGQMMFLKVIVAIDPDRTPRTWRRFWTHSTTRLRSVRTWSFCPAWWRIHSRRPRRLRTFTTNCSLMPPRWCPPIHVPLTNPSKGPTINPRLPGVRERLLPTPLTTWRPLKRFPMFARHECCATTCLWFQRPLLGRPAHEPGSTRATMRRKPSELNKSTGCEIQFGNWILRKTFAGSSSPTTTLT